MFLGSNFQLRKNFFCRFVVEDEQPDGPSNWMDDWTMFYWGWWISWSPFVGTYSLKIQKDAKQGFFKYFFRYRLIYLSVVFLLSFLFKDEKASLKAYSINFQFMV